MDFGSVEIMCGPFMLSSRFLLDDTGDVVATENDQVKSDHQRSRIRSDEGGLQPTWGILHESDNTQESDCAAATSSS